MKRFLSIMAIAVLCSFYTQATAQFEDCYAEDEWTIGTLNTGPNTFTPGVVFNNTAGTMTLTADGDFMGVSGTSFPAGIPFDCTFTDGIVKACTEVANSGTISFDWDYTMQMFFEDPANEPFGYCINGDDFVSLVTPGLYADQSGSESIEVAAGDIFCFVQASYFSEEFQAVTTVSNFSAPTCAASVTTLTDCYAEENWTVTTTNSTGSATFGSSFLVINNDTDFSGTNLDVLPCGALDGMETVCINIPTTGDFTFSWNIDGGFSFNPLIDRFGYCLNGIPTELTSINPPPFGTSNGTETVSVVAGDLFCFVYASKFGDSGSLPVTINDFDLPPCPTTFEATATATTEILLCYGDSNGTILVEATGTTGDVTYDWDSELATGNNPMNLPAGEYCVVVTNGDGSSIELCVEIMQPDELTSTLSSTPDNGIGEGTATADVSGGTPGYMFSWDTDPEQTEATATGLDGGDYTVTITDANGCSTSGTVTVEATDNINEENLVNYFEVYPNPSDGRMVLDMEFINSSSFNLILTDALGKEILSNSYQNTTRFKSEMDWTNLQAGIYHLTIVVDGVKIARKIVIQ